MFHEIWTLQAPARLSQGRLRLSLLQNIPHLQLFNPSPVNLVPDRGCPRGTQLGQFLVRELDRFCNPMLVHPSLVSRCRNANRPFLMFRYHAGPPSLTTVLVTHSRSVSGILKTFNVISLALVGRDCSM